MSSFIIVLFSGISILEEECLDSLSIRFIFISGQPCIAAKSEISLGPNNEDNLTVFFGQIRPKLFEYLIGFVDKTNLQLLNHEDCLSA